MLHSDATAALCKSMDKRVLALALRCTSIASLKPYTGDTTEMDSAHLLAGPPSPSPLPLFSRVLGKRAGGGAHAAPLTGGYYLPRQMREQFPLPLGSLLRQEKMCWWTPERSSPNFPDGGSHIFFLGPWLSKATMGKDASAPPPFAPTRGSPLAGSLAAPCALMQARL